MCFLYPKAHGKNFVRDSLSEESRQYRGKIVSVNIKIAIITWALEFIIGYSVILLLITGAKVSLHWVRLMSLIIRFAIVQLFYILSREVSKQIRTLENWYKVITSDFVSVKEAEKLLLDLKTERILIKLNLYSSMIMLR